ncbi:MAG: C2 family cysteine protease [Bacteroidota bacterium]
MSFQAIKRKYQALTQLEEVKLKKLEVINESSPITALHKAYKKIKLGERLTRSAKLKELADAIGKWEVKYQKIKGLAYTNSQIEGKLVTLHHDLITLKEESAKNSVLVKEVQGLTINKFEQLFSQASRIDEMKFSARDKAFQDLLDKVNFWLSEHPTPKSGGVAEKTLHFLQGKMGKKLSPKKLETESTGKHSFIGKIQTALEQNIIAKSNTIDEFFKLFNEAKALDEDKYTDRLKKLEELNVKIIQWTSENKEGNEDMVSTLNDLMDDAKEEITATKFYEKQAKRYAKLKKRFDDRNKPQTGSKLEQLEKMVTLIANLETAYAKWYGNQPLPKSKTQQKTMTTVEGEIDTLLQELRKHEDDAIKERIRIREEEQQKLLTELDDTTKANEFKTNPKTREKYLAQLTVEQYLNACNKTGHPSVIETIPKDDPALDIATFARSKQVWKKTKKNKYKKASLSSKKTGERKIKIEDETVYDGGHFKVPLIKFQYKGKEYYIKKSDISEFQKFISSTTPLFNGNPTINDVRQGGLGDCYLLAAAATLVNNDPNHIKGMMHDNGKGQVTVKLFKVSKGVKKKIFKPKLITVQKTIPQFKGKDSYAKGSIWVQMLEKAWTAGKFAGGHSKEMVLSTKSETKYQNIAGGLQAHSLEVLLGSPSDKYWTDLTKNAKFNQHETAITSVTSNDTKTVNFTEMPWAKKEQDTHKKAQKDPAEYKNMISYKILGKKKALVDTWIEYVDRKFIKSLFDREFSQKFKAGKKFNIYRGQVFIEDFEELFGTMIPNESGIITQALDKKVAGPMIKWLKKGKFYSGRPGTGEYSQLQLQMYDKIFQGIKDGKAVGVGSKTLVGLTSQGSGHSGGESKSSGLAGGHAYSVIDAKDDGKLKQIKVRNPWGSYVRAYEVADDQIAKLLLSQKQKMSKTTQDKVKIILARSKSLTPKKLIGIAGQENGLTAKQKLDQLLTVSEIESLESGYKRYLLEKLDDQVQIEKATLARGEGGAFWLELSELTQKFDVVTVN